MVYFNYFGRVLRNFKQHKIQKIFSFILWAGILFLSIYLLSPFYPDVYKWAKSIAENNAQAGTVPGIAEEKLIDKSPAVIKVESSKAVDYKTIELTLLSDRSIAQTNETDYPLVLKNDKDGYEYSLILTADQAGYSEISTSFANEYQRSTDINFLVYRQGSGISLISPLPDALPVRLPTFEMYLAPVSKSYYLNSDYEPGDLVDLNTIGVPTLSQGQRLREEAADALLNMYTEMKNQNLNMAVSSSYRSYESQKITYLYWLGHNGNNLTATDTISARPGHSEHQLGTTVDIVSSETNYKLTKNFSNTRSAQWLSENAYKYGFVMSYPEGSEHVTGYTFEPWHFRYIGKENTLLYKRSGLTLIEYLQNQT